ncbi:hypothetical protein FNU76_11625 [Chitinimonas arctica]|uniref:Uncharacterized protein n=1 Tax=Chitinimonas arctica TaxID=2594795 RepID=A0A516SG09_9NEIS|nr:hypothetical protein [Chitinimonas arctica]QDQ26958.1 hypothetical protein FNU76_11625 [Chitinimonas arctica]
MENISNRNAMSSNYSAGKSEDADLNTSVATLRINCFQLEVDDTLAEVNEFSPVLITLFAAPRDSEGGSVHGAQTAMVTKSNQPPPLQVMLIHVVGVSSFQQAVLILFVGAPAGSKNAAPQRNTASAPSPAAREAADNAPVEAKQPASARPATTPSVPRSSGMSSPHNVPLGRSDPRYEPPGNPLGLLGPATMATMQNPFAMAPNYGNQSSFGHFTPTYPAAISQPNRAAAIPVDITGASAAGNDQATMSDSPPTYAEATSASSVPAASSPAGAPPAYETVFPPGPYVLDISDYAAPPFYEDPPLPAGGAASPVDTVGVHADGRNQSPGDITVPDYGRMTPEQLALEKKKQLLASLEGMSATQQSSNPASQQHAEPDRAAKNPEAIERNRIDMKTGAAAVRSEIDLLQAGNPVPAA